MVEQERERAPKNDVRAYAYDMFMCSVIYDG